MLSVKLSEEITTIQTGTVANKIRNKNVRELVKPVYLLQSSYEHSVCLGIPFVWAFSSSLGSRKAKILWSEDS